MKKIFTLVFLIPFLQTVYSQTGSINLVRFTDNLSFPLGLENCGDSRLFVVQKGGQIIVCDSLGNKNPTPYLDITDRTNSSSDEGGLLGLAFDPHYLKNGFFYVNYISNDGSTKISRFKVNPKNPNIANAKSEKMILQIPHPYPNHLGGCIRFGPDGNLYIGMGDGDGSNVGDPLNYSQNTSLLLGKMLRIKIASNGTYTIPPTNPFIDSPNYRKEIWAVGLRNPWRFSFDAVTGNLYIADVGEALWEEVDVHQKIAKGGQNYGWHCYEGDHEYNTDSCLAKSKYTFPIYEYTHANQGQANDCAITGGFVYRGSQYPDLYGKYFFTDFCSGVIRTLTITGNQAAEQDVYKGSVYVYTSFGEDYKHELYLVSSGANTVYKIVSTATQAVANQNLPISMNVFPNPSQGEFSIQYSTQKAEEILLYVYASNGRQVYAEKKTTVVGNNNWKIVLPSYVKGNCYVMLSTLSGNTIRKNIIVH